MLLIGALRALAGASAAWRQATVSASASTTSIVNSLSEQLTNTALGGFSPVGLQPRRLTSLGGIAFPQSLPDPTTLVPLLRDADDDALSPHPPTTGTSPLTIRYPFPVEYYMDREAVVYSLNEQPLGLVPLPGAAFNVPVRLDILHRVVRYWRAKWQQGTHKAKRRGEVSGGGRKPRPQKKTGRSRQGSIRSPLWKGGGVSHAPLPRSHAHKLPLSVRLLGMRCALSAKIREGRFFVVEDFLRLSGSNGSIGERASGTPDSGDRIRDYLDLKQRLSRLTAGSYGSTWLLVDSGEAGRDGGVKLRKWLKGKVVMEVMSPEQLTVYHVLKYHRLVVSRATLGALADALTRPHRVRKPLKYAWWMQRKAQLDEAVLELNVAAGTGAF